MTNDKLGEHCGQLESTWIQVISSKCDRPQSWTMEHHQSSISITNQSIDHNHEQLNIINHQHQCNRHHISSHTLFFSQRPALPGLHYHIRGCHCRESTRFYCFIIKIVKKSNCKMLVRSCFFTTLIKCQSSLRSIHTKLLCNAIFLPFLLMTF